MRNFKPFKKAGFPGIPIFGGLHFRCNRDHTFWRLIPAISEPRDMEKIWEFHDLMDDTCDVFDDWKSCIWWLSWVCFVCLVWYNHIYSHYTYYRSSDSLIIATTWWVDHWTLRIVYHYPYHVFFFPAPLMVSHRWYPQCARGTTR